MEEIKIDAEKSTGWGQQPVKRATARWFLWLSLAVALFFWKVLFTGQFSILHDWEGSNQGYAWHQFAVSSFQKGIWPVWDPYAESGRGYVGEMQPGLFYPLKAILYWWPLPKDGMLSPRLWHEYYVLAHLLGAFFMFLLARGTGRDKPVRSLCCGRLFRPGRFFGNRRRPPALGQCRLAAAGLIVFAAGAARPVAEFFKRQPRLFRVHVDAKQPTYINLGDTFGVQSTIGKGAASLLDYMPFTWFPRGLDLLNVRYIAVAGKQRNGQPIYTNGTWKVYENPTGCPRAWTVHNVVLETSVEKIKEHIRSRASTCSTRPLLANRYPRNSWERGNQMPRQISLFTRPIEWN